MIQNMENMFETTVLDGNTHPLQLRFFKAGGFDCSMKGVDHVKTVPFEILLQVQEGHYEVTLRKETFRLQPGQTILVPLHQQVRFKHHDGASGRMRAHWIHFQYTVNGVYDVLSLYRVPVRLPDTLFRVVEELITSVHALDSSPPMADRWIQEQVSASRLLRLLVSCSTRDDAAWRRLHSSRLYPLLQYIQDHLDADLDVERLAHVLHLSPSRLHAVCKSETGLSPMRMVRLRRLEQAARLLVSGDLSLTEIAEQTGFSDAFHLSHAFKKHYGLPPRLYRQRAFR